MKHAAKTNILVLHYVSNLSLNAPSSFTSFVSDSDNVNILLISNKLSDADKAHCLAWEEVKNIECNGQVELSAWKLFKQHGIDLIYTQQEDLILRASHLRLLFGLPAADLLPEAALCFRDKVRMKEIASQGGFKVPEFQRVWSPANVIGFIHKNGYPVVMKPTLGSASASVVVLRSDQDRDRYLTEEFFSKIDDAGKCMDYSGDIMIESFAPGTMVHVNGYANNGKIQIAWPFTYMNTNLGFTSGTAYGNVLVPAASPHHSHLLSASQHLLSTLPCPTHLFFHLEMFETTDISGTPVYTLCEIAARRPGGSIGNLIQQCEMGSTTPPPTSPPLFQEMEFRLSCGLGLRHDRTLHSRYARADPGYSIADLMVPLKVGTLVQIPDGNACPVEGVRVIQVAKVGTTYAGFDINVMNTCVRLVAVAKDGEGVTEGMMVARLNDAHKWYNANLLYLVSK
ncbi:hypothetical protein HDU98_007580 [Podochytrium sp. JEL0797]|nr:hypothetical protein HDU98_007580 [Podochytrium sp. JEL0797]